MKLKVSALVKEVAAINNGVIEVKSEKGKGSCFSITFPLIQGSENPKTASNSDESHQIINRSVKADKLKEKETVLIIEDNQDMRTYIQNILADNFHCIQAANGKDGIAQALKQVPDIIVCDVMMPGIDGFHVCRILREEMITSHIPLILLTALVEKSSRMKGWRENIDMYLNKPFDAEELNLQLRNVLNIRSILNKNNQANIKKKIFSNLSEIDQKFINKLNATIKSSTVSKKWLQNFNYIR